MVFPDLWRFLGIEVSEVKTSVNTEAVLHPHPPNPPASTWGFLASYIEDIFLLPCVLLHRKPGS